MSAHSARRPSALQFHEDAQDDIASSAREENPALSKRLPFIHAPSTPMFFSHSQDGGELDTSNPYEEKLENSAQVSPKLGMHDSRGGSISGAAGLREKGLGVSQADWDEDDQDTYAPKGRRPSRLGGSLSGSAHYLPLSKQPLLGGEDGSDLYPSRLSKGFLGRKLPIASLLPALILGAILVALWDSRSPATPAINKAPVVSDSLWTDASDIEAGPSLRPHPNGHAYLRESALHAGDAAHPIFELIRNATEQYAFQLVSNIASDVHIDGMKKSAGKVLLWVKQFANTADDTTALLQKVSTIGMPLRKRITLAFSTNTTALINRSNHFFLYLDLSY